MAIANLPKLNFSVPFAMTAALPVEYNAYFSTLADATAAAAKAEAPGSSNTVYYYGQKIVVVGDTEAKLYIIQPDKTLKEAGGVPVGQDGVITVSDTGVIGIYGVNETTVVDGYQPRIKVIDGKKTIEWYKPDTSTVSGLQDSVKALQDTVGDSTKGLVKAVADNDTEIAGIKTDITDNVKTAISSNADAINRIETVTIPNLNTTLDGKITSNATAIAALPTKTYVDDKVSAAVASVYKPAGSIAFAALPSLSESVLGNVYNITDAFTTTADFVEGAGKSYPAGENVVVVKVNDLLLFDVLSGMVDLTDYAKTSEVNTKVSTEIDKIISGDAIAGKAQKDAKGNTIDETYATKTALAEVSGSASTTATAVDNIIKGVTAVGKATSDKNGNAIDETYATKDELLASENTLVVNITEGATVGGADATADKTFEEVKAAIDAGKLVVGLRNNHVYIADKARTTAASTWFAGHYFGDTTPSTTWTVEEQEFSFASTGAVSAFGGKTLTAVSTIKYDSDLMKKVDKIENKGLSTNDFTTALKDKLTNLPAGAQVNAIDTVSDEFTISDTKELGVAAIDKSKITGLADALDTKVENISVGGTNLTKTGTTIALPGATASALGLVKGSTVTNGIAINTDFTMTVNNISTDKLVQGTNTLIFNGGGAGA